MEKTYKLTAEQINSIAVCITKTRSAVCNAMRENAAPDHIVGMVYGEYDEILKRFAEVEFAEDILDFDRETILKAIDYTEKATIAAQVQIIDAQPDYWTEEEAEEERRIIQERYALKYRALRSALTDWIADLGL